MHTARTTMVITGASDGIGKAVAQALAPRPVARKLSVAQRVFDELGRQLNVEC
ncbi:hypothetical protein G7Y31_03905 [Corynebacterium lizhenjunii]|uniref:Uncharacterized protein n=1 Tax=Corynebacterium lizhenjunii TaxID=2709394 RepID=A0A7T0KHL0_9CORY|nr:hypothetical protein [Corynebacterium lizhenjunii]QPK79848.1 hypothetical protein G7Y31_03905 [Corynebacterium lizhenjunii]